MNPLQSNTIIIPAAVNGAPGIAKSELSGVVFYCKSATLPFKVQFDTGTQFDFEGGFQFQVGQFSKQWFFNYSAYPITVVYYIGGTGVSYVGTNDFKDAPTFNLGNLGGTGNLTPGSSGYITIPAATFSGTGVCSNLSSLLKIPGNYQGHIRKQITISTINGKDAFVIDNTGRFFCYCNNGTALAFQSSDTFYVGGYVDGALVGIGEIYYAQ